MTAFELEVKPAKEIMKAEDDLEKRCKRIRRVMYLLIPISTYGSYINRLIPAAMAPILMNLSKDPWAPTDIGLLYVALNITALPYLFLTSKILKKLGYKWIFPCTNCALFLTSIIIMVGAYFENYIIILIGYLAVGNFQAITVSVNGCLSTYWHGPHRNTAFGNSLLTVGANTAMATPVLFTSMIYAATGDSIFQTWSFFQGLCVMGVLSSFVYCKLFDKYEEYQAIQNPKKEICQSKTSMKIEEKSKDEKSKEEKSIKVNNYNKIAPISNDRRDTRDPMITVQSANMVSELPNQLEEKQAEAVLENNQQYQAPCMIN